MDVEKNELKGNSSEVSIMKNVRYIVFLLAASLSNFASSNDDPLSARNFLDVCTDNSTRALCIGYVLGMREASYLLEHSTIEIYGESAPFQSMCIPELASNGQLVDVFVKYLEENPQVHHERAMFAFIDSMRKSFC